MSYVMTIISATEATLDTHCFLEQGTPYLMKFLKSLDILVQVTFAVLSPSYTKRISLSTVFCQIHLKVNILAAGFLQTVFFVHNFKVHVYIRHLIGICVIY